MKSITWVLMGLFSGATIALTTAVLVVPEISSQARHTGAHSRVPRSGGDGAA